MTKPVNKASRVWRIGAFLLAPAALAGALYLDSLPGKPYVPPQTPIKQARPSAVEVTRLKALEERVQLLEERLAALPVSASDPDAPPPVAESALQPPATPPASAEPAVSLEDFHALQEELTQLKQRVTQESPWKNEQLVALYRLENEAQAGKAFDAALDALLADPGLAQEVHMKLLPLSEFAAEGIASESALRQQFDEATEAFAAGAMTPADNGGDTWDQIRTNLSSLVTVRKIGDSTGDSDDARIARGAEALAEGNPTGAISEISELSESAAVYFEEWLRQARLRHRTLRTIERARNMLDAEGKPAAEVHNPGSV